MPSTRPPDGSEFLDRLHDGREVSDGAGAQIIAIGEAAGHKDRIAVFQLFAFVPQKDDRLAHHFRDDVVGVVIAVGSGKNKHAKFHLHLVYQRISG